ncbi:DEAD/DEAH box helicase family protein [Trichocoleus desertorum AS-A10]|uniref:DEAD/DEAH box helicase n=1 Tax=Trichocoleus desertorum TaxID=1481672 RepID=UPI0032973315
MTSTNSVATSPFTKYQKQFHQALGDEIKSLRKLGGQTTTITDGRHLGKRSGKHLYSFTTDTEIRFPDDTPVDLVHQKQRYPGILLSIEGFDLLIAIEKNIGEQVPSARMTTEPWFLLQELQKRLDTATASKNANRQLAVDLLSSSTKSASTNNSQFSDFAPRIEAQIQQTLKYNSYQAEAITHTLQHPVSFIWGPPGTGKTSTLGLTVASLVHAGESVLVLAHSNTAVDAAMKSLGEYLCQSSYYREGLILRFGIATPGTYDKYPLLNIRGIAKKQNPQLIEEIETLEQQRRELARQSRASNLTTLQKNNLQERIAQIREKLQPLKQQLRQRESELVRKAMVVGCTLSKAAIAQEIYERQFDAVIIDEASMAYIPHCAYAATLAKRRIAIFGDFRQLGPISQADTDNTQTWLQRDIFEESGIIDRVNREQPDDRMVLLQTQYRMHPTIAAVSNHLFYSSWLKDGETVQADTQAIVDAPPNPGKSLIFYDLSGAFAFCYSDQENHSRFNLISALIAADIAYKAQQAETESIGIITPYKAQARLLHRILKETKQEQVKASTVHRFQGSEQHLIIFDAVDSTPQKKIGKLLQGGPQSTAARLANVAISRAQGKFIGLFNDSFLRQQLDSFNIFRKFSDRLRSSSQVLPLIFTDASNSVPWQFALPGVTIYPNPTAARLAIQEDLAAAQHAVAIDWPTRLYPAQHFSLASLRSGLNVIVRGSEAASIVNGLPNTRVWRADSFSSMGIVGIDQKTLWVYTSPNAQVPVFKINLSNTVNLLYTFFQLTPSDSGASVAQKLAGDQAPFGSCELCAQPLWPQPAQNRYSHPRITCVRHPHQGRNMNRQDATLYAQFMGRTCEACGSSLRGAQSGETGQIFLTCSRSSCNWKRGLNDLI